MNGTAVHRWSGTSVLALWMVVAIWLPGGWTLAQEQGPGQPPADTLPAKISLAEIPQGLADRRPVPDDNALTDERVALGRRLFFDGRLSADGTISCASCHMPDHGFASADPVAIGVGGARGTRNSPSILNRAYGTSFFWDGRSDSLEDQALQPIENSVEMATRVPVVLARLRSDADYRVQFESAYAGGITAENLARALASFQRVLLSGNSAVDRFRGGHFSALNSTERLGLWLFESRGNCWQCHRGPNFTDEAFHNTGVSWGQEPLDLGRFRVTQREEDRGGFRTPTLRHVAVTAPYMHDGSLKSLEEVVEYYNRGGNANPHLDPIIQPLHLSDREKAALVAFLKALTGADRDSDSTQAAGE